MMRGAGVSALLQRKVEAQQEAAGTSFLKLSDVVRSTKRGSAAAAQQHSSRSGERRGLLPSQREPQQSRVLL